MSFVIRRVGRSHFELTKEGSSKNSEE